MTKLKSVLASLVLATLLHAHAFAQSAGQLGPGQTWGNPTASQARGKATNLSPLWDQAFGSTRGSIMERGATVWAPVVPSATAGLPYVGNGTGADPAYQLLTGAGIAASTVANSNLSTMLANTIKGNATASSASPADLSVPNCNGATNALIWTAGTGLGCNSISSSGGGTNIQTSNYTIATTDCTKTVQVGTGSTGLLTVTLPAATGFSEGCNVTVKDGDTGRGKLLSGFPSNVNYILPPQQTVVVKVVNGAWTTVVNPTVWVLPGASPEANTYTWYVDGTNGSDTAADGLAATTGAFQTCQHAMDWISKNINANQQKIVVQVNDTSQCSGSTHLKQVAGIYDFWPDANLIFQGNVSSPLQLNCGTSICFVGLGVRGWIIQGFEMNSSGGWIEADTGSRIYIGTGSGTGNPTTGFTCIYNGAVCELIGNFTSLNTAQTFFAEMEFGGQFINAGSNTITLNNSVAYTDFYLIQGAGSSAVVSGITYAGTGASGSTGSAFTANFGGYINYGHCANYGSQGNSAYIPGNSAGTASTGWCQ